MRKPVVLTADDPQISRWCSAVSRAGARYCGVLQLNVDLLYMTSRSAHWGEVVDADPFRVDFVVAFNPQSCRAGMLLVSVWRDRNALSPRLFSAQPSCAIVGRPESVPSLHRSFPLGTDSLGRDIAAMIAYAARTTLLIGFAAKPDRDHHRTPRCHRGLFRRLGHELLMRLTNCFQTDSKPDLRADIFLDPRRRSNTYHRVGDA